MEVYIIPNNKVNDWKNETFNPVIDGHGNYVVAVNADYSMQPFYNELLQCEIIEYVAPINETL
jgi:hypothetical protein